MNVALHPDFASRPDPMGLRVLSVCTGGAGLDLGFELAFPGARSVCLVEREAFAVAHLVSAMQAGLMAPAPVWSDARTFDGRPWRGHVDFVIGGIPCQPHSVAGKRLARDDPRDLWGSFRRIVVQSGAWGCVVENVGGMVSSGGFERVWRDLRRLGFAVEAGLFRASDVGAPQERERLFVLAIHAGRMADAAGERRGEGRSEPGVRRGRDAVAGDGGELGDALGRGCDGWAEGALRSPRGRTTDQGAGGGAYGLPLFPPEPEDLAGWRAVAALDPLSLPALSRHDMFIHACRVAGLDPHGHQGGAGGPASRFHASELQGIAQRTLRRLADGVAGPLDPDRIDALRMLGNGVVPLAAGYALRTLRDAHTTRAWGGADRYVRRVSA